MITFRSLIIQLKFICIFVVQFTNLTTAGFGQKTADDPIIEGRKSIKMLMEEEQFPAVSVAVMLDGEMLWSEAFGYSDLEHKVRATTQTKFRIGSVSKSLTSAAIGILVENNRLDLDATIQNYVPEYPEKEFAISTRQLAGHLSGIPHYEQEDVINRTRYNDVIHALDKFKERPILHEPGTRFTYSSFGWNLIAAVVERAANEPFLDFMQKRVFDASNMVNTEADHYDSIISNRTEFYSVYNDEVRNAPAVDNSDVWAAGGFLSTPEDLVTFGTAMLEGKLLRSETIDLLFLSQKTNSGKETGYGIGWSVFNYQQFKAVSHSGGHLGARAILIMIPSEGLVFAIMINSDSPGFAKLWPEIFDRFLIKAASS